MNLYESERQRLLRLLDEAKRNDAMPERIEGLRADLKELERMIRDGARR